MGKKVGLSRVDGASDKDLLIPIMGPTGVGKSTFIDTLLGGNGSIIGRSLGAGTSSIQHFIVPHPNNNGYRLVFVDTPGFDDRNISDATITKAFSDWLKASYNNDIRMAGFVYLYDISQPRYATSHSPLTSFRKLCGVHPMTNVALVTTKWGKVLNEPDPELGLKREAELEAIWSQMLSQGATMTRFGDSKISAWGIVEQLLKNDPINFHIQESPLVTDAGRGELVHKMRKVWKDYIRQRLFS